MEDVIKNKVVSFFLTHHGIINSKKGREQIENKPFYEWGFHRTNNIKHPRVKISEIFQTI